MDTVLFEKDMKQKLEKLFRADDYYVEAVDIAVSSSAAHDEKIDLSQDSYYYLVSRELDIPVIASLYLSSGNNFFSTSKTDFEFDNDYKMETFRNYVHVRSENAAAAFEFKLRFLKVTPYRE